MVRIARIALGLLVLLTALPASAGVKVDFDAAADFSKYRTYSWKPGAPALNPEIEQKIIDTVDEELAADGLTRVEGQADLYVSTYAIREDMSDLSVSAEYLGGGFVLLKPDTRLSKAGTLLVRLVDAESEKPVWHGWATKTFGENPRRVIGKVGKVVRKMFSDYPPR
jgi:hypothetical protein